MLVLKRQERPMGNGMKGSVSSGWDPHASKLPTCEKKMPEELSGPERQREAYTMWATPLGSSFWFWNHEGYIRKGVVESSSVIKESCWGQCVATETLHGGPERPLCEALMGNGSQPKREKHIVANKTWREAGAVRHCDIRHGATEFGGPCCV